MRVTEHNPPSRFEPSHLEPVLFLAGPIQGAPDWQAEAMETARNVWRTDTTLHVVNPRWIAKLGEFNKTDQITWEKEYLKRASVLGGFVFFLAAESPDAPAPNKPGRSYAQTTRHEFGRAVGWKDNDPSVVIALGMEDGYVGNEDYYIHTADELGLTLHTTVDATVNAALETIQDTYREVFCG